ncbi:zinc transporter 2-like [Papaver somniferum]|uniref:zinc transporter 2-like n=1 Tax=Papaver somniferum TaxID=3469 RepID=UPI000E6F8202|nr:zinc transporter 2-like [Papaver somniferum]XP_026388754.1 zinc transporter 2-like [Papaver somniferum]
MGTIPPVEAVQSLIFGMNVVIGASISFKFSSVITMVLILLLGVCSGLEGIAVGIADNEANAWTSLWNVSLPKMIAAVTFGTGLFELLPDRPYLASIAYLSASFISTPIGVAIGTRIDAATQAAVAEWIFVFTAGCIGGIYVYDTALYGLSKRNKRLKPSFLGVFASVLVGVGVAAVISTLESYYNQSMS